MYVAVCPIDHNMELLSYLIERKGNDSGCAGMLTKLPSDPRFPVLNPNKRLISFRNRVLDCSTNRSYAHGDPFLSAEKVAGHYIDKPFEYLKYRRQMARCVCRRERRIQEKRQQYYKDATHLDMDGNPGDGEDDESWKWDVYMYPDDDLDDDEDEEKEGESKRMGNGVHEHNSAVEQKEGLQEEEPERKEGQPPAEQKYKRPHIEDAQEEEKVEKKREEKEEEIEPECQRCGFHYMRIETPAFHRIFRCQRLNVHVCEWFYALIGRMIFDVKEKDKWEIVVLLVGLAGTGKSTIMNVLRQMFDPSVIGIFDEKVEDKYPLLGVYQSQVVLGFDIGRRFNLPQTLLQQMCAGESMQVLRKHLAPKLIAHWKPQFFFACNVPPNWHSSGGAMVRRAVQLPFSYPIDKVDPYLDEKIAMEMPAIIAKCQCAYHSMIKQYGKQHIWDVLPKALKVEQEKMALLTNNIEAFVKSDWCELSVDGAAGWREFKQAYQAYCKEENLVPQQMNEVNYNYPFKKLHIRYVGRGIFTANGIPGSGAHVVGCNLAARSSAAPDPFSNVRPPRAA